VDHARVVLPDMLAQGLAGVARAARDGAVARDVGARRLVGLLRRVWDHLGAPVLPERPWHMKAGKDVLHGAATGGRLWFTTHEAFDLVVLIPLGAAP